jgi:ADP-ribose pyrophosphatase YjhB (NUDIX family)
MADINFCPRCGHAVEQRQAYGALRPVCPQCGRVHFVDPKVAVGLIIVRSSQLLLVRRANDPERGKWSIPAGFVDGGEDPARAAEREALEETGLKVRVTGLQDVYPRGGDTDGADILIVYFAEIIGGSMCAGDDAAECGYFAAESMPELAFVSTRQVLARWVGSLSTP